MREKSTCSDKGRNWAGLIFFCAAAWFVVSRKTDLPLLQAAYPLLKSIAMPGFLLLMGWESRFCADGRKRVCTGLGLIGLAYLQKVLVYWMQVATDKNPAFYPFDTSGVAWLPMVAGAWWVISGLWRENWSAPKTLAAALALGLAGGLLKPVDTKLCLAQLCAYGAFFVVGRLLPEQWLEQWSRKKVLAPLGVGILTAGAVSCWFFRAFLKKFWPLVDGDSWYGACKPLSDGLRPLLGLGFRLAWYAGALLLLWALFCLAPGRRIPWVTGQGSRAMSGYVWFLSLAYLTLAPVASRANGANILLSGVTTGALLLFSASRRAGEMVQRVIGGPWILLQDQSPAPRLGRPSFYSRHKWAVDVTVLFTVAFAIAAVAYVYPFDSNGRCIIWRTDGLSQQYPMLFYLKEYLTEGVRSLVEEGTLAFPQWDFDLGMGMSPMDVLRREPFLLLALLGDESSMELIASLTVLLRLYVCGLVFLWLCRTLGKTEKLPLVMGALIYLFSGFSLFASGRQPYFVTVMMTYLPLMLIGVERYLRQRKYGIFVLAVFLQIFNGYYTAYINGVMLAVYLLVRLGCKNGRRIRTTVKEIFTFIGFYLWGMAMGMCTFLPGVLSLSGSSRDAGQQKMDLFYSNSYYDELLSGLNLEFGGAGYWTYVSLGAIAWLAVILLFCRKEEKRLPLKVGAAAIALMLTFPIFGLAFNGFAYVSNRWSYVVGLAAALILVEVAPDLLELTKREKGVLVTAAVLYAAVIVTWEEMVNTLRLMGLAALLITALVVVSLDQFLRSRRLRMGILAVLTLCLVMLNTAASFLPGLGDYANSYVEEGEAYPDMAGAMDEALEYLPEDGSFYRVAQRQDPGNQSMALGYHSVVSYYSVIPQGLSQYFAELGITDQYQTFRIYGMNERTAAYELASVRYYLTDNPEQVPYGYEPVQVLSDGTSTLYENQYALPLGYTYTDYISRQDYEALDPVERQQVMLDAVVLDEDTDLLEKAEPEVRPQRVDCAFTRANGVVLDTEEKTIGVQKANGSIQLRFEGMANCETYVVFQGLRYQNETSRADNRLTCETEYMASSTTLKGKNQTYYFERAGIVFHLGYQEEGQTGCTLSFFKAGELRYDDVYVICVPMEGYEEKAEQLAQVTLEQVTETGDRVTGTIHLEESRLLALSIPYAAGWTAYVNGEQAELLQVNTMYCGLLLEPGTYEIELRYVHPGVQAGLVISAAAFAAILPAAALGRKKKNCAEKAL